MQYTNEKRKATDVIFFLSCVLYHRSTRRKLKIEEDISTDGSASHKERLLEANFNEGFKSTENYFLDIPSYQPITASF